MYFAVSLSIGTHLKGLNRLVEVIDKFYTQTHTT